MIRDKRGIVRKASKKKGDKKSTILIRVDVDALTRDGSLRLHIDQRGLIIARAHARARMARTGVTALPLVGR